MRTGAERSGRWLGRGLRVLVGAGCLAAGTAGPARAQFFWDSGPRLSADDAARAVMERGFRPLSRPTRNQNVYVTDVMDRRGRRERLIVSADSGDILQRFYLEDGRRDFRRRADPTIPRGPVPPARIPDDDHQPSLFSRLFGGGDDEQSDTRPPLAPDRDVAPPAPRPPRKRVPRAAERTPEPARAAPVESAPLAPPTSSPAPAATSPAPAASSPAAPVTPAPSSTATAPASDRPVRSIVTNPLAIPGSREQDDKAPTALAAKPAAAKPAAKDVPVAPLD